MCTPQLNAELLSLMRRLLNEGVSGSCPTLRKETKRDTHGDQRGHSRWPDGMKGSQDPGTSGMRLLHRERSGNATVKGRRCRDTANISYWCGVPVPVRVHT